MEKCHITNKDIEQYLFGRLNEGEESAFQQHLLICKQCSSKVRHLRRLAESFHPETIDSEEREVQQEQLRIVPLARKITPWLAAASLVLAFITGWFSGRYKLHSDQQMADNAVQTQIENSSEYASSGSVAVKPKKEFTFISPGEGIYAFNINEAFSDENDIIFKWSPKAPNALLIIKTDDGLWDEVRVKNSDHIKLNLTKYSSYRSLTWFLIVSESEEVMKGQIDLRKYLPPYIIDTQ